MFFLQFAIHFDDFAKAAGMPHKCLLLEETEIIHVESAVLWQELLARLFLPRIFTPSNKKKRAFYELAWYYVT